jgi:hypothetical protein
MRRDEFAAQQCKKCNSLVLDMQKAKRPPVRAGVLFGLPIQAKGLALQGCFAGDGADVSANNAHVGEVAVALLAECSNSRAVLTPVPV